MTYIVFGGTLSLTQSINCKTGVVGVTVTLHCTAATRTGLNPIKPYLDPPLLYLSHISFIKHYLILASQNEGPTYRTVITKLTVCEKPNIDMTKTIGLRHRL